MATPWTTSALTLNSARLGSTQETSHAIHLVAPDAPTCSIVRRSSTKWPATHKAVVNVVASSADEYVENSIAIAVTTASST